MISIVCLALLFFSSCTAEKWVIFKQYTFTDMDKVRQEWTIQKTNENGSFAFVDDNSTLYIENDQLVIHALKHTNQTGRKNITSGIIWSKQLFSPVNVSSRKLRVEMQSTVPAAMGSFPALWMYGINSTYGDSYSRGEIDIMEWVYSLNLNYDATIHWQGPHGLRSHWNTFKHVSMREFACEQTIYGVEYSAVAHKEYIQLYVRTINNKTHYGPIWHPKLWSDFTPAIKCPNITAGADRCSPLAPFDNQMHLIVDFYVGGWGATGVDSYAAFEPPGQKMYVKQITVYTTE